ncbi:VOC family protein [Metabacillus idriensis]|uniref:SMU1112c/YaeR family gloxylase I-like metalloprotein n=1 Tax=Metabacillus idriensis TaxID=324768 RepID=UPI00174E7A12|nr:VOC family protein [Metabacillus idriensis]
MKINHVHHVAIICTDYAVSKDFYVNKLGFEVIQEFYRAERDSYKLDLAVGDHIQIELFSFPSPPERPTRPEAAGLRHLAFSVEDIAEAVKHLNSHGIGTEEIRIDPFTNRRFTFFQDPDGLPLELYEDDVEKTGHNS